MRPLCASGEAAPCGERTKCFSTEGNRQGNSAELRFQDLAARRAQGGRREPARPDACSGPVKPYRLCVWGGGEDVTPHLLHGPHVIYASTWQVWIPELHY